MNDYADESKYKIDSKINRNTIITQVTVKP